MEHHLARDLDLRRHVREPEAHGQVLDDRLAEGFALSRVDERRFIRGASEPHRLRADADPSALEVRERDAVPLALGPEQVLPRDPARLERDLRGVGGALAELVLDPVDHVALGVGRHDERADPLLACLPVVMNCLTPLTIHSPPASSARVRIAAASEPACGSLRQKQPRSSPRASCGSHQLFWLSLPKLRIGPHTTEFWTLTIVAHDASPAAISSSTSASETWSSPAPPQRSGT